MPQDTVQETTAPRIVFNAALWATTADYRAAGISRHIAGLLRLLARQGEVSLTVTVADGGAGRQLDRQAQVVNLPDWARRPVGRIVCEQAYLPLLCRSRRAQLLHAPAYAMPLACPVPAVVTIHDLSFLRLPATFGRFQATYLRLATAHAVHHAAALIAVSEFTRRELMDLLGASAERIYVVPNGVDDAFRPAPPSAVAAFRTRQGLPERFILAVGTLQPRKNLVTVIEAYGRLRAMMADPPALVIAGAPGWGRDEVAQRTRELGLETLVRRLGHCGDHELALLYSGAAVVTVPSLYEGFGLPVVEAMACGTPVIIAATSSLPEVAGDAALRVPATDIDRWAGALQAVLEEPHLSSQLSAAGLDRARDFSWSRAASQTLSVYRQVMGQSARSPVVKSAGPHGG